jgi:phenylalanyl-tRNA synthetase beta chain
VAVANPLSAKFDALRPSLLPGLIDAVAHNRRHGRRDVALFEIGARFTAAGGEVRAVAFAWTGSAADEHWSGSGREVDFFDAKGVVERLSTVMQVPVTFEAVRRGYLQDGQTAGIRAGAVSLGVVGRVLPALLDRAGAPKQDAVFAAELDLEAIGRAAAASDEAVQPLPRHPFVVRDLSIVVAESLPAEIIRDTIRAAAEAQTVPLTGIAFFDRYQGKGVPEGSNSLSVRLNFQAADRTLTDAEVQRAFDTILTALASRHGAVQR